MSMEMSFELDLRLEQREPESGAQRALPLAVELARKLFKREALDEVEARVERGDMEGARELLRKAELEFPEVNAQLYDFWLALDPAGDELLYEARARIYAEAQVMEHVTADLVRALLVTTSRDIALQMLTVLAGKVEDDSWMSLARESVYARYKGHEKAERQLLLAAIRKAPDEVALFAALARNTRGSGSDVELFALRQCVRCAPYWQAARTELHRAAKAMGDMDATRIEPRPERPGDGWTMRERRHGRAA
ncbi:MAG TPA: hypothetical protein VFF73_31775 [Planctomycetota bacterium]|nr:hypothetical protein [Planctomycetota bacterium]